VTRTGGECSLDFEPALANTALVSRLDVNGRPLSYDQQISAEHHHLRIRFVLKEGLNVIRIRMANDFGVSYAFLLPELGSPSSDLRILSEEMGDLASPMDLELSGRAGTMYEMAVWNPGLIESVEGAELVKDAAGCAKLRVYFAEKDGGGYTHQRIMIHLHAPKMPKAKALKQ
jgi:hypothetical protein